MMKLVNNGTYLLFVDTEASPAKGEKFVVMYNDESYLEILENPLEDFREYADEDFTDSCYKIIAASPKLEGVPLLPELPKQEENVSIKAIEEFQKVRESYLSNYHPDVWTEGFEVGYKAASKKWSDEETKKYCKFYLNDTPTGCLYSGICCRKSLSPTLTPINFIPEYEIYEEGFQGMYGDIGVRRRKLKIVDGVLCGTYKF